MGFVKEIQKLFKERTLTQYKWGEVHIKKKESYMGSWLGIKLTHDTFNGGKHLSINLPYFSLKNSPFGAVSC